jgi:hypothetical protein
MKSTWGAMGYTGEVEGYLDIFPSFRTALRLVHMTDVDIALRHRDRGTQTDNPDKAANPTRTEMAVYLGFESAERVQSQSKWAFQRHFILVILVWGVRLPNPVYILQIREMLALALTFNPLRM